MTLRAIACVAALVLVLSAVGCTPVTVRYEGPPGSVYTFSDQWGIRQTEAVPFSRTYRFFPPDYAMQEKFLLTLPDGRTVWGLVRVLKDKSEFSKLSEYPVVRLTPAQLEPIFAEAALVETVAARPDNAPEVRVLMGRNEPPLRWDRE
jgi:hypothetical protein